MRAAIRIAFLFAILFGIYLAFAGWTARSMASSDPDVLMFWQGVRGFAAIAAATGLVFVLTWVFASRRSRVERLLASETDSFRKLFEASPLAGWVYDAESLQILAVNDLALSIYGFTRRELLNASATVFHVPGEQEEATAFLRRVKPALRSSRWKHVTRTGSEFPVEIISRPVVFSGRDARIAFARSLADDKRAEHALGETLTLRIDAEKIHWHALSAISMEMRKSLETVGSALDSLLTIAQEKETREMADSARKGVGELLTLASQTIITANRGVRPRPHDGREIEVPDFVQRILDEFFDQAEISNIKVNIEQDPSTPRCAVVNSRWLALALEVCVADALKYAQGGTVTMKTRLEKMGNNQAYLEVAVAESEPTGETRFVFEAPNILPSGDSRKHYGSAMGLFILRQICELMSASLRVSAGKEGSEIAIRIPGVFAEGKFTADSSQLPPDLAAIMA